MAAREASRATSRATSRGQPAKAGPRTPPWKRWLRAIGALCVGLFVVVLLLGVGVWWAYQAPPPFYERVRAADAARPPREGDELERRVLEARNVARRSGAWRMVVTEDQLNGWLAHHLPVEFPEALPREISDPRVSIEKDRMFIGCRYREGAIDTIVSLELQVYLTDDPRVVAAQLRSVRAGRLPIPPVKVLAPLTAATQRGSSPVRWKQEGGDPVALWTLPEKIPELSDRQVKLEKIVLRSGEMELVGTSR